MGFGPNTTTDEVLEGVDLHGKLAVVTGGTSGLGLETCCALATAGAEVLLTARDSARGAETVAKIQAAVPAGKVSWGLLALDDLASVRAFADSFLQAHGHLDFLINNAGIMATPFRRTMDGFESQFGTNHMGHFVLTNLLTPMLGKSRPSRVINLSSAGHHFSDVHWDDPNFERHEYDKWQAYGQSKTANALSSIELNRRLSDVGVNAYAVHPGAIKTGLSVHFTTDDRAALSRTMATINRELSMKSIAAGAAGAVWAATAPELTEHGGAYIEDCHIAHNGAAGLFEGVAPWARDPDAARRLWTMSEEFAGMASCVA